MISTLKVPIFVKKKGNKENQYVKVEGLEQPLDLNLIQAAHGSIKPEYFDVCDPTFVDLNAIGYFLIYAEFDSSLRYISENSKTKVIYRRDVEKIALVTERVEYFDNGILNKKTGLYKPVANFKTPPANIIWERVVAVKDFSLIAPVGEIYIRYEGVRVTTMEVEYVPWFKCYNNELIKTIKEEKL